MLVGKSQQCDMAAASKPEDLSEAPGGLLGLRGDYQIRAEIVRRFESDLAQEREARQKLARRRVWWSTTATILATIVAVLAVVMIMGYRVHDVEVQAANQQIKAANETIQQERQRASWLEEELRFARRDGDL